MEEANKPSYYRKLKRFQLTALVDIFEAESQLMVGRLVNIHAEGLMVIGSHHFVESEQYQLILQLPKSYLERDTITLDVDCLWTRNAQEDGDTTWSGFSIAHCSEAAKSDLDALIDAMGV